MHILWLAPMLFGHEWRHMKFPIPRPNELKKKNKETDWPINFKHTIELEYKCEIKSLNSYENS